jgi:clusterin-associated protein 1
MKQYVTNLEKDQRTLEEKIRKRNKELEQADKRLKGIRSVKPAY